MSVVKILDDVKTWVEEEICSKVQLKAPPEGDEPNDRDYDHSLVNPVAFTMYVPTKDKLPPSVKAVFPSVCVRFLDGTENMTAKEGSIGIQLCFSAWDARSSWGRSVGWGSGSIPDKPDRCSQGRYMHLLR